MRSLPALAMVLLLVPAAVRAEEPATPPPVAAAAPAAPQVTLVEVFETKQALVFDRVERQYVVVAAGSAVQGFQVASVTSQQLELVHSSQPGRHYIITLPVSATIGRVVAPAPIATPKSPPVVKAPSAPVVIQPFKPTEPEPAEPAPVVQPFKPSAPAPEAPAAPAGDAPLDPYAGATTLPTREIKVVRAPEASRPEGSGVPAAPAPEPDTAPAPEPAAPRPAVLTRHQLDHALANLESLSAAIELSLGRGGVVVNAIQAGSLGHQLGLRTGDVIHSVAGVPTRRLEDGADVYVRLGQVNSFDIEITRSGRRLALPVVIK